MVKEKTWHSLPSKQLYNEWKDIYIKVKENIIIMLPIWDSVWHLIQ